MIIFHLKKVIYITLLIHPNMTITIQRKGMIKLALILLVELSIVEAFLDEVPRRRLSRHTDSSYSNLLKPSTIAHRLRTTSALSFSPGELWGIRIASGLLTYTSFVAYTDRPRGTLMVDASEYLQTQTSQVPGAGLGLFVTQTLRQGTILGTYPGVVVPLQQNLNKLRDFPQCEGYTWRFSDNQCIIDPTNPQGNIEEYCKGGSSGMPLSVPLFQTVLSFVQVPTMLCRINEPPKGRDVNVVTKEDLERRTVTFTLERDVYEGEELFIDYGLTYDRSMYGGANNKNNGDDSDEEG